MTRYEQREQMLDIFDMGVLRSHIRENLQEVGENSPYSNVVGNSGILGEHSSSDSANNSDWLVFIEKLLKNSLMSKVSNTSTGDIDAQDTQAIISDINLNNRK